MIKHPTIEILNWFDSAFALNGLDMAILCILLGACIASFVLIFASRQIRESKEITKSIELCRLDADLTFQRSMLFQRVSIQLMNDQAFIDAFAQCLKNSVANKSQKEV